MKACLRAGAVLAAFYLAAGCSPGGRTPDGPVPAAAVDLSAFRPQFEFRGRIIFQSDLDGDNDIYLLTRDGLSRITDDPASDEFPRWSPDGLRIAFSSNRTGSYQIHVCDADGSNVRQVTRGEHDAIEEGWFPDGKRIAYTEQRRRGIGRSYTLFTVDLGSGATERLLPEFDGSSALPDFAPNGPLLAFTGKRLMGWDAYRADLRTGETKALTEGGKACRARFSPDGARLAFVSSEADGKGDIWQMDPDGGAKDRLTDLAETYDYFPAWSPDGKYVVFSSGTKHYPTEGEWRLMLVKVGTKRGIPLFRSGARDVFPDWR